MKKDVAKPKGLGWEVEETWHKQVDKRQDMEDPSQVRSGLGPDIVL